MTTSTGQYPTTASSWLISWRDQAYLYRQIAALTISIGVYLHVTRVLMADDDLLLAHIMTPTVDRVLTIPMTYAAIVGVFAWRQLALDGRGRRIAYWASWFYIAASVPLHVATAYVQGSTEYLKFFPLWFSYLLFPVYALMLWFWWRLPLRRGKAS